MPAKEAKPSKCFPLLNTSVLILLQTLDMLEPPASALIPTEDIAAEKAKISDSDIFTKEPVPASRSAISVISDSVVAKLLPKLTMVEPKRSKFSWLVPVIFASLAIATAASSLERLVAVPILTTVSENFSKFFVSIPSCPAIAITSANSLGLTTLRDLLVSKIEVLSAENSSSVASTVFFTPAKALSKLIEASITFFVPATTVVVMAKPKPARAPAKLLATPKPPDFALLLSLFNPCVKPLESIFVSNIKLPSATISPPYLLPKSICKITFLLIIRTHIRKSIQAF